MPDTEVQAASRAAIPPTSARTTPDAGVTKRLRVEELAAETGVSVDTVRYYQKLRLLPPPDRVGRIAWYDQRHHERLERIRELAEQGLTLALIGRVLRGELDGADAPLAAAVADAVARDRDNDPLLTLEELATQSGIDPVLLATIVDEGLLVPLIVGGVDHYTASDRQVVEAGLAMIEAGLPLDELLTLARSHHAATTEIAEQAVAMFDDAVRRPLRTTTPDEESRAQELVAAFRTLLPAATALVDHHFRRVLLTTAQAHLNRVGEPAEVRAATLESERRADGR